MKKIMLVLAVVLMLGLGSLGKSGTEVAGDYDPGTGGGGGSLWVIAGDEDPGTGGGGGS